MSYDSKRTIPRYMFIVIPMTLFGLAIIGKAVYEMTMQQNYWETVRSRMATQQRIIPAIRGNIYSTDGQLMVGSMPIYTLRMDFVVKDPNNPKAEAKMQARRDSLFRLKCDSLLFFWKGKSADVVTCSSRARYPILNINKRWSCHSSMRDDSYQVSIRKRFHNGRNLMAPCAHAL